MAITTTRSDAKTRIGALLTEIDELSAGLWNIAHGLDSADSIQRAAAFGACKQLRATAKEWKSAGVLANAGRLT